MTLASELHMGRIDLPLTQQLWRCLRCESYRFNLDHWYGDEVPAVYLPDLDALRLEVARRAYPLPNDSGP